VSELKEPQLPEPEKAEQPVRVIETLALLGLLAAVLSLFLFGKLATEMREGDTVALDMTVRSWIHQFASPAMTLAMKAISLLGYDVLVLELVAAIAVFLRLRWRKAAAWLGITMVGAVALDVALKNAFHRQRPVPFFGDAPHSYSFPSGHALASLCFYGVLAGLIASRIEKLSWRISVGITAAVLVLAIGISRIYLGVHYPSDVVAGYLAAAMWVSTMLVIDHFGTRTISRVRARRRVPH
jgi:membrane-associated phospholipid phosphatase